MDVLSYIVKFLFKLLIVVAFSFFYAMFSLILVPVGCIYYLFIYNEESDNHNLDDKIDNKNIESEN